MQQKKPEDITIAVTQGDLVQLATNMVQSNPAVATEAKNIALVRMVMERDTKIVELEAQLAAKSDNGVAEELEGVKEIVGG